MAIVYLWKHTETQTGHVSLETNNGYLSFHPQSKNISDILCSKGHNSEGLFQEDCDTYGSYNYDALEINGMDDDIDEYIYEYMNSEHTYSVFPNNCASMVAHALLYGYSKKSNTSMLEDISIYFENWFHGFTSHNASKVENDVMGKVEHLMQLSVRAKKTSGLAFVQALLGVTHAIMWTLHEVSVLAKKMS